MTTIINRFAVVRRNPTGVIIGLFWQDKDSANPIEIKEKFLEYPKGGILQSVETAIMKLCDKWGNELLGNSERAQVSVNIDGNPDKFDMLIASEETEQAFVSRYMLE